MEMLTKAELEKCQTTLEEEKKRIVSSNGLKEDYHIDSNEIKDEADSASMDTSQSLQMRFKNRETLYLKKIQHALSRIRNGEYQDCEGCDEPINPKRLLARPTATLCINCKEEAERFEQQTIDGRQHKSLGSSWQPD